MEVTKPYEFIGFGGIHGPKPYKFIGFGAMEVTKPYKFIGFGAVEITKPHKFYSRCRTDPEWGLEEEGLCASLGEAAHKALRWARV